MPPMTRATVRVAVSKRRRPFRLCLLSLHALLVALLLIAGCGTSGGGGGASTVPPATSTATATAAPHATVDPATQVPLNWAAAPATLTDGPNSLSVALQGADQLTYRNYTSLYPTLGIACAPELVLTPAALATPQLSPADVMALRDYLANISRTEQEYPVPDRSTSPPASLRWVAGVSGGDCKYQLQVANSANSPHSVEISRVGVHLIAATPNQYRYALIDVCTIAEQHFDVPCSGGLSGVGCDQVTYFEVQVPLGVVGSDSSGDIVTCARLDVPPGATGAVNVDLVPPARDTATVYQAEPELTVKDVATGATQTFTLPSFASTLVYAAPSQFACYGLGNDNAWHQELSSPNNSFCV